MLKEFFKRILSNLKNQRSFIPLEVNGEKEKSRNNTPLTGFSLVEVLVALGILVLTMIVATAISVSAIRAQKENKSFREVQDDGRYIMEMMMKEIRMSKIERPAEISEEEWIEPLILDKLAFLNTEDKTVIYEKNESQQLIKTVDDESLPLNSDKVKVKGLKFFLGSIPQLYKESGYRRVTVVLNLESGDGRSSLNLQTTISTRPSPCPTGACAKIIPQD